MTNGPGVWSWPLPTEIPDVDSNINAGSLPDGRIYLLSNPVVASTTRRNPLVISLTDDGTNFDRAMVVASCLAPPYSRPGQPDGCKMRNASTGKVQWLRNQFDPPFFTPFYQPTPSHSPQMPCLHHAAREHSC